MAMVAMKVRYLESEFFCGFEFPIKASKTSIRLSMHENGYSVTSPRSSFNSDKDILYAKNEKFAQLK